MTYSPPVLGVPAMVCVETPRVSLLPSYLGIGSGTYSSATWPSANQAHYYPILIPSTTVVRRLWWTNGASVSATYNVDCGIYADAGYKPGVQLISTGSTAQGTASQVQFVDVADTTLAPGQYWLALVVDNGSATIRRASPVFNADALFKFVQSSAMPLPTTATPAESDSRTIQLFGFATTASP